MGLPRYTQSVNEGNITQWHIIKFERLLISNMTRTWGKPEISNVADRVEKRPPHTAMMIMYLTPSNSMPEKPSQKTWYNIT